MRTCFAARLRRVIAVGCAVSTISTRIETIAVVERVRRRRPPPSSRGRSRRTSRAAAGAADRAGSRAGGGRDDAASAMLASVRKCENARATGTAMSSGSAAQRLLERAERVAVRRARRLGDPPDALDGVEQRRPFARPQRVAQHLAEHRHVVAQRLVRIATASVTAGAAAPGGTRGRPGRSADPSRSRRRARPTLPRTASATARRRTAAAPRRTE